MVQTTIKSWRHHLWPSPCFTDTDLQKRAHQDCTCPVGWKTADEQLQYFMQNLPCEFTRYGAQQTSDYLALNAGLVAT